jgi:hypothetical protein
MVLAIGVLWSSDKNTALVMLGYSVQVRAEVNVVNLTI